MINFRYIVWMLVFAFGVSAAASIVSSSQESRIALIGERSQLYLNKTLSGFMGSLVASGAAKCALQGAEMVCHGGHIAVGPTRGWLLGVFDPSRPADIALSGGCSFIGDRGCSVERINVSGCNNRLGGWLNPEVVLHVADENAKVDLSLEGRLGRGFELNGGYVRFFSNIELGAGAVVGGGGVIDAAGRAFVLRSGKTSFEGAIEWVGSCEIRLEDRLKLAGVWTLGGAAPVVMRINGMGNELDLSSGGRIMIQSGSCLILENVVIKGLSDVAGAIVFQDETASLICIGCTLALSGDWSVTTGFVTFREESSTVVTGPYALTFGGMSSLKVDGVTLLYDTQNAINAPGVILVSPLNFCACNDGEIKSVTFVREDTSLVIHDECAVRSGCIDVTSDAPLIFKGGNSQVQRLVGFDLFVRCVTPYGHAPLIVVTDGTAATLEKLIIDNFDPSCVTCGEGASLAFGDGVELCLAHAVALTKPLLITGNVLIKGEGNVIDCSKGGMISVAPGACVTLQDVVLVGLGDSFGQIALADNSSMVKFKNSSIALAGTYTPTIGQWYFYGMSSSIITGNNLLSFSGASKCVIDGVHVVYDPLSAPDSNNLRSGLSDGSSIVCKKGGSYGVVNSTRVAGSLDLVDAVHDLQRNEALSADRVLRVVVDGDCCEVDGHGFGVMFPYGIRNVIEVGACKKLKMRNVVLKDFSSDHVYLGEGAVFALGDGARVEMAHDFVLSNVVTISGNVVLDCGGHSILLQDNGRFVVEPGARLEVRNGFFPDLSDAVSPFVMEDVSSCLIFNDMACTLERDYTFAQGSLEIGGTTKFSTHRNVFRYVSEGGLTVGPKAMLMLDQDSTFRYDVKSGQSKLTFAGLSSSIYLDNARLSVGAGGAFLKGGTLWVNGLSVVDGEVGDSARGLHIDAASFDVNVLSNATLDIQGLVVND